MQRGPSTYVFDPADPRAPTHEQWEQMSAEERAHVVAMLPSEVPSDAMAERARADAERARVEAEVERARAEAERARAEAERARAEAERARAEAERDRAAALERALTRALDEIERLKNR